MDSSLYSQSIKSASKHYILKHKQYSSASISPLVDPSLITIQKIPQKQHSVLTFTMTDQSTKSLAFFGSTGGCALAALDNSLRAGYCVSALVRSAQKLKDMLSKTTPTANLRIVEGDALQVDDAKRVLVDEKTGLFVDTIIYGLGTRPEGNNPLTFKFTQPTFCEDTMKVIVTALEELKLSVPPFICAISTTGVAGENDVPLMSRPFYHYALDVPHKDKGRMEEVTIDAKSRGIFRDYILIRPSLLTDGKASYGKIKVGYEGSAKSAVQGVLTLAEGGCGWRTVDGPAIGYVISRKDVGAFIFEEAVYHSGKNFSGQKVTLTN